jgi:YggT family protein
VVFSILTALVEAYVVVLIARALLSWLLMGNPHRHVLTLYRLLETVTEPVLRPIRRILPPVRLGGAYLDLSIILVILVAQVVIIPLLRG